MRGFGPRFFMGCPSARSFGGAGHSTMPMLTGRGKFSFAAVPLFSALAGWPMEEIGSAMATTASQGPQSLLSVLQTEVIQGIQGILNEISSYKNNAALLQVAVSSATRF